jgi:hypothetical protein
MKLKVQRISFLFDLQNWDFFCRLAGTGRRCNLNCDSKRLGQMKLPPTIHLFEVTADPREV